MNQTETDVHLLLVISQFQSLRIWSSFDCKLISKEDSYTLHELLEDSCAAFRHVPSTGIIEGNFSNENMSTLIDFLI